MALDFFFFDTPNIPGGTGIVVYLTGKTGSGTCTFLEKNNHHAFFDFLDFFLKCSLVSELTRDIDAREYRGLPAYWFRILHGILHGTVCLTIMYDCIVSSVTRVQSTT